MPAEDQSLDYGEQFAEVYDRIFPRAGAEAAAEFLLGLAGGQRTFVELGVGTGRVAVPLAARGGSVVGVDTSPTLLARAREIVAAERVDVELVEADIRRWRAPRPVAVTYCVCATISMLACRNEQRSVLGHAAASTRPDGRVVVETHSPDRVRRMHEQAARITYATDIDGLPGGLESRATLTGDHWTVDHTWHDQGRGRTATEFSLLTPPDVLDALAADTGLTPDGRYSGWTGAPYDPMSPTYVAVYRPVPGAGSR